MQLSTPGQVINKVMLDRIKTAVESHLGDEKAGFILPMAVRIWDLIILLPNTFFLLYLLLKLKTAVAKLRNTSSPIFTVFYGLVMVVAAISVLRCVVSMTVNATAQAGKIADKLLWLILRFFLLGTELSVVIFGLAFGHLDSHTSIRRVLFVTSFIALAYSSTQGILEFLYPDPSFHVAGRPSVNDTAQDYDIFGHGGMIFWLTSSLFFCIVYTVIFFLPWTTLKDKLNLPSKKSFYYYAAFLATLNSLQSIGSGLLIGSEPSGMCLVDLTTYIYFTCFDPLVYGTFLWEFFRTTQPTILFSYKHQIDDAAADNDSVHLPYASSVKGDDEKSIDGSYDSTHFDRQYTSVPNGVLAINADPEPSSYSTDFYQGSI
ncbi:hypothetical protein ScPMuIL_008940 [Solemya velum]